MWGQFTALNQSSWPIPPHWPPVYFNWKQQITLPPTAASCARSDTVAETLLARKTNWHFYVRVSVFEFVRCAEWAESAPTNWSTINNDVLWRWKHYSSLILKTQTANTHAGRWIKHLLSGTPAAHLWFSDSYEWIYWTQNAVTGKVRTLLRRFPQVLIPMVTQNKHLTVTIINALHYKWVVVLYCSHEGCTYLLPWMYCVCFEV